MPVFLFTAFFAFKFRSARGSLKFYDVGCLQTFLMSCSSSVIFLLHQSLRNSRNSLSGFHHIISVLSIKPLHIFFYFLHIILALHYLQNKEILVILITFWIKKIFVNINSTISFYTKMIIYRFGNKLSRTRYI